MNSVNYNLNSQQLEIEIFIETKKSQSTFHYLTHPDQSIGNSIPNVTEFSAELMTTQNLLMIDGNVPVRCSIAL